MTMPYPNSLTFKKRILGYALLNITQQTTQTMSVIKKIAFIEFVKAFDSTLNTDLHV